MHDTDVPGIFSPKFRAYLIAGLATAMLSWVGGGLVVPVVLIFGLGLAASGGADIARQKGYSFLAGILAGVTWPLGVLILLARPDRKQA